MLPVLFQIVIPNGWAKPLFVVGVLVFATFRAIDFMRRAKREGQPIGFVQAIAADGWLSAMLGGVGSFLWFNGYLDGTVRLPLHTYGLLIAAAFLVGIWLSQREGARRGQDPEKIADLCFWILVAALVGSRVYYIALHMDDYFGPGQFMTKVGATSIPRILVVWEGGLVFYGGFIGAVLAAYLYMRAAKMNFLAVTDTLVPQLALGHFLGRLGCFAAGCCWGGAMETPHAWGAEFPPESLAFQTLASQKPSLIAADHLHTVALHPTQLYEAFGELGLFFVLVLLVRPRKAFHGQVMATWLLLYGVQRSITELFRGDLDRGGFAGINSAQWTSLFIIAAGVAVWALGRKVRASLEPLPA